MVVRYGLHGSLPATTAPVGPTDSVVPLMSWLLLALLAVAYTCAIIDRTLLSLLVEPIKADLHLTDTQISLLQGLAFLLTYSTMAIPIGLLIDRVQRTWLVALGISLWSVMTALCGTAHHIWSLFLARAGVGIGESVLSPAARVVLDALSRVPLPKGACRTGCRTARDPEYGQPEATMKQQ
jgi:MFS family permease